MTWKVRFEFRILGLFRVPPPNLQTWKSQAGGEALGQLADLA